jgi:membrane-bound ClpP family serine protease
VSARTPTLPPRPERGPVSKENNVIVLGLVLLVVGFLLHISILWTLGIILLVIGAILAILGGTGRMVGGRRHWY